jgi:hypothetical protein
MSADHEHSGPATSSDGRDHGHSPVPPRHRCVARSTCTRLAAALLVGLFTFAQAVPARAADEVETDADPATEGTPALWGTGVGVLTSSWLASTFVYFVATFEVTKCTSFAYDPQADVDACERRRAEKQERSAPVTIPLVGPFIAASTLPADGDVSGGLLALGAIEAVGVGLIIAGLAWRHEVPGKPPRKPGAVIVPQLGTGHAGLAVHGGF